MVAVKQLSACAAILAAAASATDPAPLNQWKSTCAQTTSGDISGIRPGTQHFDKYYDYPNRDRYDFTNGNQQVYRFDIVDPRTKFGKAFGWNKADPSNCCFIWLENVSGFVETVFSSFLTF